MVGGKWIAPALALGLLAGAAVAADTKTPSVRCQAALAERVADETMQNGEGPTWEHHMQGSRQGNQVDFQVSDDLWFSRKMATYHCTGCDYSRIIQQVIDSSDGYLEISITDKSPFGLGDGDELDIIYKNPETKSSGSLTFTFRPGAHYHAFYTLRTPHGQTRGRIDTTDKGISSWAARRKIRLLEADKMGQLCDQYGALLRWDGTGRLPLDVASYRSFFEGLEPFATTAMADRDMGIFKRAKLLQSVKAYLAPVFGEAAGE